MSGNITILKSPLRILIFIIGYIILFGVGYYLSSPNTFKGHYELSFIDSLYLSVVTFTTLGFGDITPVTNTGKILTIIESFVGILLIGTFINSTWQQHTNSLLLKQKKTLNDSKKNDEKKQILDFYLYLKVVIDDYLRVCATIINSDNIDKLTKNFRFINFSTLAYTSKEVSDGLSMSNIQKYYTKEEVLLDDLKFFLANLPLNNFPEIRKDVIAMLTISRVSEYKSFLLTFFDSKYENEEGKYEEWLEKFELRGLMVSEFDMSELFEKIDSYDKSYSLVKPLIMFNKALAIKILRMIDIKSKLELLMKNTDN